MSRNAFPKIERDMAEADAMRDHAAYERELAAAGCEHETGQRFKKYDADGCGYYLWRCDYCGYEEIDYMP